MVDVMVADRCEDCDIGLIDFCLRFSEKTRDLFDLCVCHKLILKEKKCEVCRKAAVLDFNKKLWRCQKKSGKGHKKKTKCSWQQNRPALARLTRPSWSRELSLAGEQGGQQGNPILQPNELDVVVMVLWC
ncbi:hypothetical protein E2C01_007354 [Portunus trituberculatus]|uniref:Uncharacterized protein n=1 Tax=Portunus trituberculatus TaxID=210409 RepID=A0A5B7D278_PORTR|nr:hypothetical protein [Portunus trituberculatus]